MRPDAALAAAVLALASGAGAEGLDGRTVQMRTEAWDQAGLPWLRSRDYVATVGPGPEFGFSPETMNGLVVVPATVDVDANAVTVSYASLPPGAFVDARFNGYVLTFPAGCTLLRGAVVDPATTLPIKDAAVFVGPTELRLDLAGLRYGPKDRVVLRLDVADCPLS